MIQGIEPQVIALRDVIQANIDSALTAVEAEWTGSDAISLPRPRSECYYLSQKLELQQFPSVVILGNRSTHSLQTGSYIYHEKSSGGGHECSILWVDKYNDPGILRRTLYRTSRALCQILAQHYNLDGACIQVTVEQEDFAPAFTSGDNVFIQSVELLVTCQTEEAI